MGLKAILESLDGVDDAHKAFYKEVEGQFVLDVEGVDDHPSVRRLKNAHEAQKKANVELRDAKTAIEAKLAELPADFDAEKWHQLNAAAASDKKAKDEAAEGLKAMYEKRLTDIEAAKAKEIAERDAKNTALNAELDSYVRNDALRSSLIKVNVNKELMDAAVALLGPKIAVRTDESGRRIPVFPDDLGDIPVEKYVSEWGNTTGKPFIAPASGPSGSGGGAIGGTKTMRRAEFDALDPAEKATRMTSGWKIAD